MADKDLKNTLKAILKPEKFLAVYNLENLDPKGTILTGPQAAGGFMPNPEHDQKFYDLSFHPILIPLSKLPLASLLQIDLAETLLPSPKAEDFPEQCLGLVVILDQTRVFTGGSYNQRYTRCFFDPICEKLARPLTALPDDVRPDRANAWLARGYTFEQYLSRVLMIWAPLVHSDNFMVNDRQQVKDFIHRTRAEVEAHYHVLDPYAPSKHKTTST